MRRLALLVALAGVLADGVARAQSMAVSTTPAAAVEGDGIALGSRLVLHAGIGAELRYDSNVFYQDSNAVSALALRLTPKFLLATRVKRDGSPHKFDFRIGAGLDYREWLVSSNGQRPPRQFNVTAGAAATILPTGPVTVDLYDNYVRSIQPPYQVATFNYDRDVNEIGTRFRIKPGGGRLELQLSYTFGIDYWETKAQQVYNNYYHHSNLRLLYKFLPKTSVYLMADNIVYQYWTSAATQTALDRPDGYPLRIMAGLNGLLTSKLTFDIYGGYTNGFYKFGPSPSTGIAGLTLTWRPFTLSTSTLAYRHDFENTLLGVYANFDNISISWMQQIWRFAAFLRLSYQNTRYQGIAAASGVVTDQGAATSTRTDNQFALNARVDFYTYKNWLALSLGYDFNILRSNTALSTMTMATAAVIPTNFVKHEVYLGVSLYY